MMKQELKVEAWIDGLPAMLAKQIPYTMAKQVTFDALASTLYHVIGRFPTYQGITVQISTASALLSGIVACLASQPGDVILTEVYRTNQSPKRNFQKVVSDININRGIGGYFVGVSARLFHVVSIVTIQLVTYDYVKQFLGLPATGT